MEPRKDTDEHCLCERRIGTITQEKEKNKDIRIRCRDRWEKDHWI
jgi:hypothetical protein